MRPLKARKKNEYTFYNLESNVPKNTGLLMTGSHENAPVLFQIIPRVRRQFLIVASPGYFHSYKSNLYIPIRQCPAIEIEMCFLCLFVLVFPGDFVDFIPAPEPRSGLMIVEGNAIFHTLQMCVQHPGVVTDPCLGSGFPAAGDGSDLTAVLL